MNTTNISKEKQENETFAILTIAGIVIFIFMCYYCCYNNDKTNIENKIIRANYRLEIRSENN
tara:strand:- start:3692 stop:3877 length:186 start_codon:yes stop_codon:yes gene_type:complete